MRYGNIVTPYMEKILAGERPSDAEWYEHLLAFNKLHPAGTPQIMRPFLDNAGRSSYEILASAVANGARVANVIDVGCGDGALTNDLRAVLPDALIVGVDIASASIDLARANVRDTRARFVQAHAAKLPIASGSIDVVVSHMALMLMPDVEEVLLECKRMLRNGGQLAFVVDEPAARDQASTKIFAEVVSHVREAYPHFALENPGDARMREVSAIRRFLATLGFTDVATTSFQTAAQLDAEACWTFFDRTYIVGMLEGEAHERVMRNIRSAIPTDSTTMRMPLLLVTANTAA